MKLIAATNNAHKLKEIKAILENTCVEVISMHDAGLHMEIEENGSTFEENAMIKAEAVFKATGCASIADDSGLEVDVLGGEPGIYSARYAGENASDKDRIDKLFRNLADVPDENRGAQFVSAVACVLDQNTRFVVRGICRGQIIRECRGEDGFGYDPCFYVPEIGCTYSQLPSDEKNKISHRGNALKLFLEEFRKHI